MALNTTSDFQLAINKILFYVDQAFGGIDKNGFWIYSKLLHEDFQTLMTNYYVYKQTRLGTYGTNAADVVNNATPSVNKTTFTDGGKPIEATSPTTW
jgi:hypothetical protein